jgi:hypothetical protein
LLLCMVGVAVLYTTTEAKVVRNYVVALLLADIGHVAITCYIMPYEKLIDIGTWNPMAWGNIGVTVDNLSPSLYCTNTLIDGLVWDSYCIPFGPIWPR